MPKIIFGIVLVAFVALAACVGIRSPQARGVGADPGVAGGDGLLVSNSLPAMAVAPAPGFRPIVHGVMEADASLDGSALGARSARVWYALHAGPDGKSQLAADLADVSGDGWGWALNPMFTERRGLKMLREMEISRYGANWTALTYVRPAAKDPWMPAFAEAGAGWDGPVLLRQYTWWTVANQAKVVVEYREPLPEGMYLEDDRAELRAFEERADASFRLLRKEQGDTLPLNIEKARKNNGRISTRLLSEVLGEVNPGVGVKFDSL